MYTTGPNGIIIRNVLAYNMKAENKNIYQK